MHHFDAEAEMIPILKKKGICIVNIHVHKIIKICQGWRYEFWFFEILDSPEPRIQKSAPTGRGLFLFTKTSRNHLIKISL